MLQHNMTQKKMMQLVKFDKDTLLEIVEEIAPFKYLFDLEKLEKHFLDIQRYQAKKAPKVFVGRIRKCVSAIEKLADEMFEKSKQYDEDYADEDSLPNILKKTILDWLIPVKQQLPAKKQIQKKQVKASVLIEKEQLPSIIFNQNDFRDLIAAFKTTPENSERLTSYIKIVEQRVYEIMNHITSNNPAILHNAMRAALQDINDIAEAIYTLEGRRNATLAQTVRYNLQQMIIPLQKELDKHQEMSNEERTELALKTKHLYAGQSYYSRQVEFGQLLMQHLDTIKMFTTSKSRQNVQCYICYALPSRKNQGLEYWVQPFLSVLYDHLTAAGITVTMDQRDAPLGGSMRRYVEKSTQPGRPIILVGTESLLDQQYSDKYLIRTKLRLIKNRFEQDKGQFGSSRIYPLLLGGTINSSFPKLFDTTVLDANVGGYLQLLQTLINSICKERIESNEAPVTRLWDSMISEVLPTFPLDPNAIEQELAYDYHRQSLYSLRQDISFAQAKQTNNNIMNQPNEPPALKRLNSHKKKSTLFSKPDTTSEEKKPWFILSNNDGNKDGVHPNNQSDVKLMMPEQSKEQEAHPQLVTNKESKTKYPEELEIYKRGVESENESYPDKFKRLGIDDPDCYCCKISLAIPVIPVFVFAGDILYDLRVIEKYIDKDSGIGIEPFTRQKFTIKDIRPARAICNILDYMIIQAKAQQAEAESNLQKHTVIEALGQEQQPQPQPLPQTLQQQNSSTQNTQLLSSKERGGEVTTIITPKSGAASQFTFFSTDSSYDGINTTSESLMRGSDPMQVDSIIQSPELNSEQAQGIEASVNRNSLFIDFNIHQSMALLIYNEMGLMKQHLLDLELPGEFSSSHFNALDILLRVRGLTPDQAMAEMQELNEDEAQDMVNNAGLYKFKH